MSEPIGVVVATHHRVDDARTTIEVIRSTWTSTWFDRVVLVHCYNGPAGRYRPSGLEDEHLEVAPERTHFRGAASLIDAGLGKLASLDPELRVAVVIAADVWLYEPAWVADVLERMRASSSRLAGASWEISSRAHGLARNATAGFLPITGLSTDLLFMDLPWGFEHGMLPLAYGEFLDRHEDLLNYVQEMPFLERYVLGRLLGAVRRELMLSPGKDPWGSEGLRRGRERLLLLEERVITPEGGGQSHKDHWPGLGLVTSEDPHVKRGIALANPQLRGPTLDRLRASADLTWFNRGDP